MHDSVSSGHFQRLARHLEVKGRSAEAVEVQRAALQHAKRVFGPSHHQTITAQVALGSALRAAGAPREAVRVLRRGCRGLPAERDKFTCWNNLALAMDMLGQEGKAEAHFRKAYHGMAKVSGNDSLGTANIAINLAAHLRGRQRYGEAETLYRSASMARDSALGAAHPETLDAEASWAACLLSLNRFAEAEQVQRKALPHGSSAQAHSTLGQALRLQGKVSEAIDHFRVVYEIFSAEGHPKSNLFAAASNLASALHDAKRWEEAAPLYAAAVDGLEETLGQDANTQAARLNYNNFLKEMAAAGMTSSATERRRKKSLMVTPSHHSESLDSVIHQTPRWSSWNRSCEASIWRRSHGGHPTPRTLIARKILQWNHCSSCHE
eukprot:symbB.v1.2.012276.t1/scaffold845.1/size159878/6